MTTTMKRCVALGSLLLAATGALGAQDAFRLVSAQVVTLTDRPPTLKLSANGPIAFRVLPASETNAPAIPQHVVARLYGVAPGELAVVSGLEPFSVTVRAEGRDTIVTVTATGDVRLELRSAMRANEVEVVASAIGR